MKKENNILDIQPKETARAFEAWRNYRDLGPKRTHRKVSDAKTIGGKKVADYHTVVKWSAKWKWADRLTQWKRDQEETFRAKEEEAIQAMVARHTRVSLILQNKASEKLNLLNGEDLTVKDALEYVKEGIRVERQSRGEPEMISKVTGTVATNFIDELNKAYDDFKQNSRSSKK